MIKSATNIEELLEKCRLGNQHAQMLVYHKYYKAMYNTALRIVKNSMEAEDIMQESFLKAFTKLDSFKGESTFGAWLKKIVVNRSINSFHKNEKYKEVSYQDEFKNAHEDGIDLKQLDESQDPKARLLLKTLDCLKENYRIALTLSLIEGYDNEEISEIMSISPANCRTTISRAKESLRNKMMSYEN